MAFLQSLRSWWGAGGAIGESTGSQNTTPNSTLVEGASNIGADGALQISAVWACIDVRASMIASLPYFVYETTGGKKTLARKSRLYQLLHESPNSRMTPFEFWRAMMLNHDLRGNAYARLERDSAGEVVAMWPMPSDQITPKVLPDGSMVYEYRIDGGIAIIADANCLHLKNLGNGTVGLSKLEFMRGTTDEAAKAQSAASKVFGTGGKPTGVLMMDKVLSKEQRAAVLANFAGMAEGNASRLYLLEASMKYQQLSMSPEDQQLLETRQYGVEEVCRWFGVPPVLVHHANVSTWGSGIAEIVDGFYKLVIRPMLVNIEQATRKRVMTPAQRARQTAEFAFDALLRGSLKDRMEIYSKAVQNGIFSRAECRQLENMPDIAGSDALTAQSNLLPLDKLGAQPAPVVPVLPPKEAANDASKAEKAQDQRHLEVLTLIKASGEHKPAQAGATNVHLGGVTVQVSKADAPVPIVNVTNQVNPTPVEVNVKNDVLPTPVEVNASFEAVVQPAAVLLTLPNRKTVGTVERNSAGQITKTIQTETDL